jgi:VWFA-related protein
VCAAGSWLLAQQVPPQAPPPQRSPVFRAGANFVLVDAYPVADGGFVEGLKATDFEIRENGRPQAVEEFEFIRVEPGPESDRPDPRNQAEMLALAADPHNRVFVAYLDIYHTNVTGSHGMQRPLVDLLEQVLAPRDLFAATTPRQRPRDIVFGRKTTSLERQLADNWIWGMRQSYEREPEEQTLESCFKFFDYTRYGTPRYVPDGVLSVQLGQVLIARRREDKVITHLEDLITYLGSLREARKIVLVFTNGWLLYKPDPATHDRVMKVMIDEYGPPPLPGVGVAGGKVVTGERAYTASTPSCNSEFSRLMLLDNEQRMRDLVNFAQRHNVTFYPVNPSGLEVFDRGANEMKPTDPPGAMTQDMLRTEFRAEALRTLAGNTDGIAVITNDLRGGLRRIVDDVSAYYVLGYYSTDRDFNGGYRRIEVKVNRPGVQVRARRGYFAPKVGAGPPPEASKAPVTAAPAGLTDALGSLARLRADTTLFAHGAIEGTDAQVAIELGFPQLGAFASGGDVQVTAMDAAGTTLAAAASTIAPGARGASMRVPLGKAPDGPVTIRVTAKAGSAAPLDARVEARPNPSTLLGDAMVFRASPAGTSPLRPAADFQFRRTERVHVEWPIRGTLGRRDARLLNRTGQPLAVPVTVTEREADGRRALAADLQLAPLADGDYVIELTAGGAGEPERRYVAIRIVR